jgi:phage terminase large subunit-like protein
MAKKTPLKPFTVEHFRRWAAGLVLDSGDPWKLEPFQAAFVKDLFAGFLESWLVIPEGNAKTTLAGAVVLYHAQHKPNAMVTVAASSRDQAAWLYLAAAGFVERSDTIRPRFKCQEGFRRIRCDSMGSRIQVFAADDRTGDGAMPTLAVLEELHRHRTLRLYRTWRGKIEKRGGQIVAISTAGEPDGEFEEVRARMRSEAKTTVRGAFQRSATKDYVLHEYAVPDGKSPDVMADVKKANPLKSITVAQLKRKYASPSMTPGHWRRFVCGMPAGMDDQPIQPEDWDRLRVDIGQVEDGEQVVLVPSVGHNAAVAIVADRPDGRVAVRVEVLDPEDGASMLVKTEERILKLCDRYDVAGVYHPLGAFIRSADLLTDKGVPMHEAPHSVTRLTAASGTFNRLLRSGELLHDGDPVLRSHALAATQKTSETGERYEITDRSRGLIAAVFAVHAAADIPSGPDTIILPSESFG